MTNFERELLIIEGMTTQREREKAYERLWKLTGGVNPHTGEAWLTPRMKREAKSLMDSWSLLSVKCTSCHHEGQATKAGSACDWCKEGTMEKI